MNKVAVLELLEHLPAESRQKVCEEVDRVLREGGVLVVTVPYKEK